MPHLVVDCTESVLELADPGTLMRTVYEAAASTGLFAGSGPGGIKVRLHPYRHYLNVDATEHFVHVFAHIMEGRDEAQKLVLAKSVVAGLSALLPEVEIISVNVTEFERATYWNASLYRGRSQ